MQEIVGNNPGPCARGIPFIPQGTLSTSSWSHLVPQGTLSTSSWQPRLASRPFHGLTFSHLVLNIIGAAGRDWLTKKSPPEGASHSISKHHLNPVGTAPPRRSSLIDLIVAIRREGAAPTLGAEKNCRRGRSCASLRPRHTVHTPGHLLDRFLVSPCPEHNRRSRSRTCECSATPG